MTWKFFKELEDSTELQVMQDIKQVSLRHETKSQLNYHVLLLFNKEISIADYLSESIQQEWSEPGILYLWILLVHFEDLREIDQKSLQKIIELLDSLGTEPMANFSTNEEDPNSWRLYLLLLKISHRLYLAEGNRKQAGKKSVLSFMEVKKHSIVQMVSQNEFWVRIMRSLMVLYTNNRYLFKKLWTANKEERIEGYERSMMNELKSDDLQIPEYSLQETLRMMLCFGASLDRLNTFCGAVCDLKLLSSRSILSVMVSLENRLLKMHSPPLPASASNDVLMQRLCHYLPLTDLIQYASSSRKTYHSSLPTILEHTMRNFKYPQSTRMQIWTLYLRVWERPPAPTSAQTPLEPKVEELIVMDLNRSLNFMDEQYYDPIRAVLRWVAAEYPEVGYFQGMNYIAIFLFYSFEKDEMLARRFFALLVERHLREYLHRSFESVMKLIFVCDKFLETLYPSLWAKLAKGGVSSLHFAVPNLITLFTSLIKTPESYGYIYEIWDALLADGFLSIVKALLLILEIQQGQIFKIPHDQLLIVMKQVERDPFAILKHYQSDEDKLKAQCKHLNKARLALLPVSKSSQRLYESFYSHVRHPLHKRWDLS